MAAAGLLALIDDIATLLDDVSILTKVAAKKTAGVLGDDLALNAEQVSGVRADRELAVVWAVAVGSIKNKLILVPLAWLLSTFLPWSIAPLLMLGGAYLCYEGFEKIAHQLFHKAAHGEAKVALKQAIVDTNIDFKAFEAEKIKGAIRTDFILSAEIVVITLGTLADVGVAKQLLVLSVIAAVITIGVYGTVAGIVKLDDAGIALMAKRGQGVWREFQRGFGRILLAACPYLMKTLSVLGTIAMFLVGGGILIHGLPFGHDLTHWFESLPLLHVAPHWITGNVVSFGFGVLAGIVLVALMQLFTRVRGR